MRVLPPALAARRIRRGRIGNPDDAQSRSYAQIIRLARTCSERAVLRLAELTQSGDERVALLASQSLLDRAFGKTRGLTDSPSADGAAAEKRLLSLITVLIAEFGTDL